MRKYISYILATALLFVCCAKTEVGLDESEVLVVSTNNIELDCDANEVTVLVNSLSSYSVSCNVGWREWVTASAMKGASGKTKIKFSFAQNNTVSPRNATITIENSTYGVSETISVSQEAGAPFIRSSVTEISADVEHFTTKIDVDSNIDYTISSSEKWCHLNRTSGKSGKTTLDITIDANTDTLSRKATITLENKEHKITKTVSVSQGAFNPVVTVETERLEFAAEGGEKHVEINANCDYKATTDADWLTVEQTSTGIKVTALSYVEVTERTADIIIASEKYNLVNIIKVSQGAFVPELTVMPTTLDFTSDGGDKSVAITANIDYEVTETADWLKVEQTTTGIKVTALSYAEVTDRTADITITNTKYSLTQTIKVTQGAFKPLLTAVQATLNFTSDGGTKSVTITANIDYEVTENSDWLTVEQTSTGIKVTALSYAEITDRTADITITNTKYSLTQTIKVTQGAFRPVLTAEQATLSFTSDGGTKSVTITANIDYQVTENADWLMVEQTATGIKVTVLSYYEVTDRTADITITNTKYNHSQTIKVMQGAFVPNITAEQPTLHFTSDGGTKSVTITANIGYEVTENADWLTVEQTSTGLNITALPNEEEQSRIAEINITNSKYSRTQTIKVTQVAFVPVLTVESTNLQFSVEGGLEAVTITSNLDYQVTQTADWLTIKKSGSGITISASAYTGVTKRTASVVVSNEKYARSKTVNVIQIGINDLITSEPNRVLVYTSSNNSTVTPYMTSRFDAKIVFNRYIEGCGYIIFDKPITSIGNSAFWNCSGLTSIIIPNSVTSIGDSAFEDCYRLTSITIPNSVTSIGGNPFESCSKLKEFKGKFASSDGRCLIVDGVLNSFAPSGLTTYTIPNSVTSIGESAFSYCESLTSITIGNSVTSIGNYAFYECDGLTSITIPNSVTSVGYFAFYSCSGLTSVYCKATTPPTLGGSDIFALNGSSRKIYVPTVSVSAYKSASYWSNYASSIVGYNFELGIEVACEILYTSSNGTIVKPYFPSAFDANITSNIYQGGYGVIMFDKEITSIGEKAFRECEDLTSIIIPSSVTAIGVEAFYRCSSLTSVIIPNSVTSIGGDAFRNCYNLTNITIPNGVTEIGYYAFNSCGLTSITIPNSVNRIGTYAFAMCFSLTSVYCKATTPPTLDRVWVFDNNASDRKIYVPTASVSAYKAAYGWSNYADDIVGYDF